MVQWHSFIYLIIYPGHVIVIYHVQHSSGLGTSHTNQAHIHSVKEESVINLTKEYFT